ncbi:MAG: cell division protein FtsL [Pseudomonadota bacterium]
MKAGLFIALYLGVVLSACGLVYSKHLERRYFMELQALEEQSLQLQTEWERLLLEESTWSNQARIEQIASNELNMHLLEYSDVVMLRLDRGDGE